MASSFNNVIPRALDYFSEVEKLAGIQKRIESYIYPETGNNSYGPTNNIIRFRFNAGMLDLRDSFWEFTGTCAATGGTYCRFSQGMSCVINRLRVLVGSNCMIDISNANVLYQLFLLGQDPGFLNSTAAVLMGYTSQTVRNTDATNANRNYNINLGYICELLNIVWPSDFISDQICVEIYLEQANRCIETDGTNPTYVINTNQYHYGAFECTEEYLSLVRDKINSGGIMIPYKSYENYVGNVTAGATNIQVVVPFKRQCLLGITYCARDNTVVSNPAISDKFQTFLNYTSFSSSRLKINDSYWPNDRVNNVYEAYIQNLELWCLEHVLPVQYGTNWPQYFVISQSVAQDPRHLDHNDIISGIDTSQSTSTVTAELVLNSPGASVLEEVQYFGYYYGLMYIRPNKSITFQQ